MFYVEPENGERVVQQIVRSGRKGPGDDLSALGTTVI